MTLAIGVAIIVVAEALLVIDVVLRNGAVAPRVPLGEPAGWLQTATRWIAVSMTPLCWVGFLLLADGLLHAFAGSRGGDTEWSDSPVRQHPRRFAVCFLASIPIWLFFDWVNFSFLDAWRYHGLPGSIVHLYTGYFLAFGAICPGMFLTAELYLRLGPRRWRTRGLRLGHAHLVTFFCIGLVLLAVPFIVHDPVSNAALWLSPILVLDPLNHWVGAPSIFGDWRAGRWGRTVTLMAGGATCGLLWEFWNYWAAAKWTYNLPFLGPLEDARYFEMPWIGLLGFPPFGIACWVMFQSILAVIRKVGSDSPEFRTGVDAIL